MARIRSVTGQRVAALDSGWELTATAPGAVSAPPDLPQGGAWIPAPVPGTAAQALRNAGQWTLAAPQPLHDRDFWYRTRFSADGAHTLRLHGLATLAEVWLNGEQLLRSDNMFHAHDVAVRLRGDNELCLSFRALHPALAKKKGRARWRPRLIEPGTLRFARTTLLGHMAGWCPPVHAVGPWRPVELLTADSPLNVARADLRTGVDGTTGVLGVTLGVDGPGAARQPASFVMVGDVRVPLAWRDANTLHAEARLDDVALWWPHTHGTPALHAVRASVGDVAIDLGQVGFRTIAVDHGPDGQGFALVVNGVPVFCRGACWSSADLVSLPGTREAYRPWLQRMRDAGMNMVRIGGTMVYESDDFFRLCDELGLLVWQDFMFANLDYPANDPAFADSVAREADQLLDRTQASPSLAVLCGGSEVAQQAAMLGLPRAAWSGKLFDEILPAAARAARPDVPYVANSPTGGPLPFAANSNVSHYYGVGAYLRPLEDARRAEVRFTSECLAFANVPEAATVAQVLDAGEAPPTHPKWKARVPRDAGAPWDFEDVRDHYLRLLYDVDPLALRYGNPDRYLRLSRAVTGEVMEAVFAEWRRGRSCCAGGLVWMLQDLWPGAGWGVIDALGAPKAAWHALRRAFRPVQVNLTDEGVNGLAVHVLNETAAAVSATLSIACLRDGAVPVLKAERRLDLAPRSAQEIAAASLADSFLDITYAYRFGPPSHDVTVAALIDDQGVRLAEAFHFPQGRGSARFELGLSATLEARGDGGWDLRLRAQRCAQSVHVEDEQFRADDEWFHLAPGIERVVRLVARQASSGAVPDGDVQALNGLSPVRIRRSS
ncbi:glycoside hydrolase family 2 protein [Vineibacter terrae]|uniref:glycoside hydrolase family 2 protein n=1 Tax=Vineibacter terrae TaxID=2586908 RepID=UPI002E301710|nr:glycoside hydrolase family 2 protein [Vineibacter terrae]HEX2885217.1 glycoside hydrolase family 2 protein [Vineibacter terrae]